MTKPRGRSSFDCSRRISWISISTSVRSCSIPTRSRKSFRTRNLVLWEKRRQFETVRDFRAWAFQIARYKVLEHRAQRKRKCLCFSDALVDELALQAPHYAKVDNDLIDGLRRCVAQLAARDRELLSQRYSSLTSCESIAKAIGRPVRWVYNGLSRIRRELLDCMARYANTWRER